MLKVKLSDIQNSSPAVAHEVLNSVIWESYHMSLWLPLSKEARERLSGFAKELRNSITKADSTFSNWQQIKHEYKVAMLALENAVNAELLLDSDHTELHRRIRRHVRPVWVMGVMEDDSYGTLVNFFCSNGKHTQNTANWNGQKSPDNYARFMRDCQATLANLNEQPYA